jgi:hypothetical protein
MDDGDKLQPMGAGQGKLRFEEIALGDEDLKIVGEASFIPGTCKLQSGP